jgi:sugar transferase (PEP-CTERM/EpsH1 system associated)
LKPLQKPPRPRHRPLIAHVVFRLVVGGLENGVVNLINRMPAERYRHAVIALTEVTDFRRRIVREDVEFVSLRKPPGHGWRVFPRLYRVFRELAPTVVHSRNLAALEASAPAWLAGVPVRVHGEHGRDVGDLDGANVTYRRARRLYRPFVQHYVALSQDLSSYLQSAIGIPPSRIAHICNGVDTQRFAPDPAGRAPIAGCPFDRDDLWLVGTVGRLQDVKDQVTLAQAFVHACAREAMPGRLRLVIAGEGPLRPRIESVLASAGLMGRAWFAGERSDVPELLRGLDCFVLPSLAEGISNTILEAMASGLPVVATRVGGNPELVDDGVTGCLVPSAQPQAMAAAIEHYAGDPDLARRHGAAGRAQALERFSLERMVADYQALYDELCDRHAGAARLRAVGSRTER